MDILATEKIGQAAVEHVPAERGAKLAVRVSGHNGTRTPVVMLHGLQSHSGWFAQSQSFLAGLGCPVYAMDRRGSGRSEGPRGDCSDFHEMMRDVHAVVDWARTRHGVEKAHVFGHCFGAIPAALFAAAYPDLVKLWLSKFYQDHPEIVSRKVLLIVSPEMETRAPDGTPCGAESGHAYRNIPKPLQSLYVCPYEVFEIEDYEARYYTMLRIAAAESLSLIVTVNPSTLLVLGERLAKYTRSIIRDIRQGGLNRRMKVSERLREKLKDHLRPNPDRAHELELAAAKMGHKLQPKAAWPDLAAIACWQGGTVGTYLEKLGRYFPEDIPLRDLGYLASEVRASVPMFDDADTGVLAIATNVYEFFPAGTARKPKRTELLRADQVEPGKRYFVYVTTLGGLYRYDMNDIVEVVAYHHKTPMIRFVQKGKGIVSFTGEKLSEAQVLAAVEEAFRPVEGKYDFISAVGEMNGDKPHYAFLAEFDRTPAPAQLQKIAQAVDDSLCAQNAEYASKRKSFRLDPPVLRVVRRGAFDEYRKRKVNGGRPDGQFKILRLTADEGFAKEFDAVRDVGPASNGRPRAKRNRTAKLRDRT